jgi:1,4-dihydroxy-2-naphthoate polyprenyltransferase
MQRTFSRQSPPPPAPLLPCPHSVTIPAMNQPTPPTKTRAWLTAARPRTLPLALASIGMGSFLAASHGRFNLPVALLCALTTIFLQILSNLANDYGDTKHGADSATRQGPRRVVQMGLISAAEMKRGMAVTAGLAMLSGVVLVVVAFGWAQVLLLGLFLGLGGAAVWAAVAYTATSKPYGYIGLGDLFVLLFFGWVGTLGSYFVQAQTLPVDLWLPATAVGLLAVGVLNINNMRDIESDQQAGKNSIPVRLGLTAARRYHLALLGGSMACATLYVLLNLHAWWQWAFVLAVPLLWRNGAAVWRLPSSQMDPLLKQLALTTLLFVLTFGLGQ